MDAGEDTGQAPAAERPAPLKEVLPQVGIGRHGGIGYELVLSNAMPQLDRDRGKEFGVAEFKVLERRMMAGMQTVLKEREQRKQEGGGSRPSREGGEGGRRRRRP